MSKYNNGSNLGGASPPASLTGTPQLAIQQSLDLAVQHHTAGRLPEAERLYQQILQTDPNQPFALHLLGAIAYQVGQTDIAVDLIAKALAINPEFSEAHNNLGLALQDLGKLDEAIACYNKALAIIPDDIEAHYNLGLALQDLGKLDEAVVSYHKVLTINPNFAEAHNNLGKAFNELGRLEEAVASCQQALAINPDYAEALNNLGNAYREVGKPDNAVGSYHKALTIKPNFAEAHGNLGNVLQELGKFDEAIAHYKQVLSLKPDSYQTFQSLGSALEKQGNPQEAISYFQQGFTSRTGIQSVGKKEYFPATSTLLLELTNKCNFHCDFCPSDSQTRVIGFMDLELAKKTYEEVADKKLALQVDLHLMGEPTLHPKLIEILIFGASKNVKTELVTNGSTLVAKVVPRILDALYGTIVASHMTPTEDTYHVRGKVGLSWDRYIGNIRLLVREYMKRLAKGEIIRNEIDLRIMVTKDTASNVSIIKSSEEARAIFTEWRDFTAEVERELGMPAFKRQDPDDDDLLPENQHSFTKYRLQKGIVLTFWKAFTFANSRVSDDYDLQAMEETIYCTRPFKDFGVLWNGDVTLCCMDYDGQLKVGNIQEESIESVMQGEAANNLRASMLGRHPLAPVCKTCTAKLVKRKDTHP